MRPYEFIRACLADGILTCNCLTGEVELRGKPVGTKSARGYLVVTVRAYGVRKQVKLHQVVWATNGGALPAGRVLDHINRIKTDNRIGNLRLVTQSENSNNRRSYKGAANPAAIIDESVAASIRLRHKAVRSYTKVAAEFRVSRSLAAAIVRGELWNN